MPLRILQKSSISEFEKWFYEAAETGAVALVDKDPDWTSFDVIGKLRPVLRIKKIGHAGTLDPLATGLLILCIGKATKKVSEFQGMEKKYIATIKLGATTKTDDSEAEEENLKDTAHLKESEIRKAVSSFVGEISQVPPVYSAKKVKGKRLYQLARKNIEVKPEPVLVNVHSITIMEVDLPYLKIEVHCSKGTYIRSLARDIGEALGVGAYLSSLRRTAIGIYKVDQALKIGEIVGLVDEYRKNNP